MVSRTKGIFVFVLALYVFFGYFTLFGTESNFSKCIDHNKNGKIDKYENPEVPINDRIIDLLSRMTLEEKTGQLLQYPEFYLRTNDGFSRENAVKLIKDYKMGSLVKNLVGSSPEEWGKISNKIQRIALEETRLGIPIIIGDDIIHGYAMLEGATVLPVRLGQAATWNPDLVQKGASLTAKESRCVGTHWSFAPTLSVVRDPRWGRTEETFGEDVYLVSEMGVALVKGYQGKTLNSDSTILAGPKHFAGDGESIGGRNADIIDISERHLREVILSPFKASVEAGAGNIMAAHHAINNIPCHANSELMTGILREEWGFDGFVVSDWVDIERMYQIYKTAATVEEAGKQAIEAGIDMDMLGAWEDEPAFGTPLLRMVEKGEVSEEILDRAAGRILKIKFLLGLFEKPYVDTERINSIVNSQEHREFSYKMACESIVLLKNENKMLPLNKDEIKSIAVIGPNADNPAHQLGDWTAMEPREMISTVLDGIRRKVSGENEIFYVEGCKVLGKEGADLSKAVDVAKKSDVVILVVGGASQRYDITQRTCGENFDRATLDLPGIQGKLVKAVYSTGVPIVLVLINGRPLTINWEVENISAIVEAWYPGQEGGRAIADVLFGNYNPGGKLPMTFPCYVGHIPVYYDMSTSRGMRNYVASGIYNEIEPLFPFGYGLSYTIFEYDNLKIEPEEADKNVKEIKISLDVKNIGSIKGDEVVQLYIRDNYASIVRPIKQLKGFKRITLLPGEKKKVIFCLPLRNLAFYNINNERVVEPGTFHIMLGSSSEDIRLEGEAAFTGEEMKVNGREVFTKVILE
jgi:beta-glucosidase